MMADESEVIRLARGLRVNPGIARLISCLYGAKGRAVGMATLLHAVPPRDASADPLDRADNNIRVWVWRARGALGVDAIATAHGLGYSLTPVGLEKVAAVLK